MVNKPAQIPNDNKNNNDNSEADDNSVWSFDDMDEDKTAPAQAVANTIRTRKLISRKIATRRNHA